MTKDLTLNDFRKTLDYQISRGVYLNDSLLVPEGEDVDAALSRIRRMLDAMTEEERSNPDLITDSSVVRIAERSGTRPQDVRMFLAQFDQVRVLVRRMAGLTFWQRLKMVLGFGGPPWASERQHP